MDFEYSSEQKLLWDSVRKLMQRVTTPEYLRRLDRERIYPYELYDAWVDAGLFALSFAEEYGGAGGNVVDLAIVSKEIGRYSANVAMAFGGSMFYALNVARKGLEAGCVIVDQKQRHALPVVRLRMVAWACGDRTITARATRGIFSRRHIALTR